MRVVKLIDDSYEGSELYRSICVIELTPEKRVDIVVTECSIGVLDTVYSANDPNLYFPDFDFNEEQAFSLASDCFNDDYGNRPMTENRMKEILETFISFDTLNIDKGITVIHEIGNFKVGVSYESDICEKENVYIYNLFYNDEYINISGYGTENMHVPNEITREITDAWNKLLKLNNGTVSEEGRV